MRRLVCVSLAALLTATACDLSGPPPLSYTRLTTGRNHTCALNTRGDAFCWGSDSSGQLGIGGPTTVPHPRPTMVTNAPPFFRLTTFVNHTCGIALGLKANCWGANGSGQLATGDSVNRGEPFLNPTLVPFLTVATGDQHTCGLVGVDSSGSGADSTVFCWGDNTYGQLGDSSNNPSVVAKRVASGTVNFVTITTGARHSCALAPDGAAYCWGDNAMGQLGDGTTVGANAPVPVSGGLLFRRVVAGNAHTCGLTTNSIAYCWGRGEEGQLGAALAETCGGIDCSTTPLNVDPVLTFGTLTAGAEHSCAVTGNSSALCWGRNTDGQLGFATTEQCGAGGVACSSSPGIVSGGLSISGIVAGGAHTCAFSIEGQAYCWGANGSGQLGDGTTTPRITPAAVLDP